MSRSGEVKAVVDYWLRHYINECCSLCGNSGIIDTRGVKTAAGVKVGRLNWCICPNGQALRNSGLELDDTTLDHFRS